MPAAESADEKKEVRLERVDWTFECRLATEMKGRDVVPGRMAEEEHGRAEES